MSGLVDQSADARSKTIGGNSRVRAWGRIENNTLTSSSGISGISVSGTSTRFYTVTLSPAMTNDDYAVVTCGYSHEGGQVEGTFGVKTGVGGVYPTTTSFMLEYVGNGTPDIDFLGFAVFGA